MYNKNKNFISVYIYIVRYICITRTRISSQFTFIVYDTYILYMYIYTGYLWGKKITVFHNLNLCIYTGCPKKKVGMITRAVQNNGGHFE